MRDGERQVAPLLRDIRRDHLARYHWAARTLDKGARVVDVACGVGYGSWMLASCGYRVTGIDCDQEALRYAQEHYAHRSCTYTAGDASESLALGEQDAAVCFETIEHVADARPLLRSLHAAAPLLLASVPNEDVYPFGDGVAFHHRHYTRGQFHALLNECGWKVRDWYGQEGPESDVEPGINGRTLIAVCDRADGGVWQKREPSKPVADLAPKTVPEHVALIGLGPSSAQYENIVKRLGGRRAFCDETWTINALGDVYASDRIFHMDDVRIQQIRADAKPESNIAQMLAWLKTHPGPIYTSRGHDDYPGMVEFPLEAVINDCGHAYFNSTAAYAVAFAIHLGVKKLTLFGCDFTYPNAHDAEKGRACVEFWLGIAAARGIKLAMPKQSTLMDAMAPFADRLYGYDTMNVEIRQQAEGAFAVSMTPLATLPTADDIETRYDHKAHPNPLVKTQWTEAPMPLRPDGAADGVEK